jgi:exopolysaccharide biosynthesis polyprenyl glycosylphosphotransferase
MEAQQRRTVRVSRNIVFEPNAGRAEMSLHQESPRLIPTTWLQNGRLNAINAFRTAQNRVDPLFCKLFPCCVDFSVLFFFLFLATSEQHDDPFSLGNCTLLILGGTFLSMLLNRIAVADLWQFSGTTMRQLFVRAALAVTTTSLVVAFTAGFLLQAAGSAELLWLQVGLLPLSAAAHAMMAYLGGLRHTVPMRLALVGQAAQFATFEAGLRRRSGQGAVVVVRVDGAVDTEIEHLRHLILGLHVDVVVLATAGLEADRLSEVSRALAETPARLCFLADPMFFDPALEEAFRWSGLGVVEVLPQPRRSAEWSFKRGTDVAFASAALAFMAPLLLVIAIAIRLESQGPVLFRQWRAGLGGSPIQVLKFRSMYIQGCDVSGAARTRARDPRVTHVGRFLRRTSLDELPQLWNVLRGDMSLVGPRPHALAMRVEGKLYAEAVSQYRLRHRVRPGITGWAQVNGARGEVDTLERAQKRILLDLWYVDHWSLALDVQVLLRTLFGGFASFKAD